MTEAYHRWLSAAASRARVMHGLPGVKLPRSGEMLAAAPNAGGVRWGGWGEDRSVYTQALFAPSGEEARTVHLGIDIFAEAGAEVFAPLAGVVQSFQVNRAAGDYGPTIILEHAPTPGLTF